MQTLNWDTATDSDHLADQVKSQIVCPQFVWVWQRPSADSPAQQTSTHLHSLPGPPVPFRGGQETPQCEFSSSCSPLFRLSVCLCLRLICGTRPAQHSTPDLSNTAAFSCHQPPPAFDFQSALPFPLHHYQYILLKKKKKTWCEVSG